VVVVVSAAAETGEDPDFPQGGTVKKIRDADYAELWADYAKTRAPETKARLVEAYFPLVRYIAERLSSTLPASVDVDDLTSMGTFGLIEANDRFDSTRGFQFKTYCTARIRGAILDSLRTNDWVPRLVRLRVNLVDKTLRRLHADLGREPTTLEMADALGMSLDQFRELCEEASPVSMLSLTDETADDPEGGSRMIDLVRDEKGLDPRREQQRRDVQDVLFRNLSDKERTILAMYYYEGLSMREIATMLKLTESRICQIHAKVLKRLKELHDTRKAELFV
jgi:RNA polymerase sigma factor for flagellar operon FliA